MPEIETRSMFRFRWVFDLKPVSSRFRSIYFRMVIPGLIIECKENSPSCDYSARVESGVRVGLFNPLRRVAINEAPKMLTLIDTRRATWILRGFSPRDRWEEIPCGDANGEVVRYA